MKRRWIGVCVVVLALAAADSAAGQHAAEPATAILGALDIELQLLESQLADARPHIIEGVRFTEGRLGGRRVILARSGVGKVNAAITTTLLIEHFRPSEILFTGVAGALASQLRPGDVVLAARTAQHDLGTLTNDGLARWGARALADTARNPIFFPADSLLLRIASSAAAGVRLTTVPGGEQQPRVIVGTVLTGDVFVASSAKKRELLAALEGDAVEMEGAAVAQVCWQLGRLPLLVIRSISDAADDSARLAFEQFRDVAARNSATLVRAIVDELAAATGVPAPPARD